MAVQIGAKPDSGYEDPISMLKDCHRRIEYFLKILCIVVERARARTLTSLETAAVKSALSYFRTGGQRHNADEEESLFPRLRADLCFCSFEEIAGLESDHQTANALHKQIDQDYRSWIDNKRLSTMEEKRLLDATRRLRHLYNQHIKIEEGIVFPHAVEVLDPATIAAIGQEFRARRQEPSAQLPPLKSRVSI